MSASPVSSVFPAPGPCPFSALPDPYQTAFRQGSAHHLPGQFLPAQIDWFLQIFLLPFALMYAAPLLVLVPGLIIQALQHPGNYLRFWQMMVASSPLQIAFTLGLLLLIGVLMGVMALQAWDYSRGLMDTWRATQGRRRGDYGYGLVLLSHGLVGRLLEKMGSHRCLWVPRSAIADIVWQQVREEGAKQVRYVYRTRLCYRSASGQHHWLTLEGGLVDLGYDAGDSRGDRALYDTLIAWWQLPNADAAH